MGARHWALTALAVGCLVGCASDDSEPSAPAGTAATTASDSGQAASSTGTAPNVSYARCDDPDEGCDSADCRERTVEGADWLVCVPPCQEGADCPITSGNASPMCDDGGRCAIVCNPDVAVCPTGMTCIEGEPSQCMWPLEPMDAGVPDLPTLCMAACDECMAAQLLDWSDAECAAECAADLGDCDADELAAALLCPGSATCSAGGLALSACLGELECKE